MIIRWYNKKIKKSKKSSVYYNSLKLEKKESSKLNLIPYTSREFVGTARVFFVWDHTRNQLLFDLILSLPMCEPNSVYRIDV